MKEIKLSQGFFAIVDDEDFERLTQYSWHITRCQGRVYARTNDVKKTLYMHRLVMGARTGQFVDHIKSNRLDNRKTNLRFCTQQQNTRNSTKIKEGSSGYKGVSWHKLVQKWRAYIVIDNKQIHLGLFLSEMDAAYAYDQAAKKYFRDFAYLNFRESA